MKPNVSRLKTAGDSIVVIWNELPGGGTVPTFRNIYHILLEAPTDYCDHIHEKTRLRGALLKSKSMKSAMDAATYALRWFFAFLQIRSINWKDVTDADLADFRDWAYKQTRLDGKNRGEFSAKRTTNVKLRVIYDYYRWAVDEALLLPEGALGPRNCAITSSLLPAQDRNFSDPHDDKHLYPLCFPHVGEASRTKGGQYWATTRDLNLLEEHFWDTYSEEVAARETLIMAIGDCVGWRIGSINSLVTQDFAEALIAEAVAAGDAGLLVRPEKQKFGYSKPFEVPWPLVYRICDYIKQDRKEIMQRNGVTEREALHRVFLSTTDGLPIRDASLVKNFSDAFHAIGVQKGAGSQSLRRKFAEGALREELEYRIRAGLSTAREDVLPAVAESLGHNSIVAQAAYIRVTRSMRRISIELELRDKAAADAVTIAALRAENSALRRQVSEAKADTQKNKSSRRTKPI